MYYSQAGEDKFLYENIFSKSDKFPKTYIEMGAIDGVKYSNTKFFEDHHGWTGILIEPNPVMFKSLKRNRPNNYLSDSIVSDSLHEVEFSYFDSENLAAVSGVTSTLTRHNKTNFFENDDIWFKEMRKSHLITVKKKPITLDQIIIDSEMTEFGFCSLDVEGHELNVLNSYSFDYEIMFFLIEVNPNSNEITKLMIEKDYSFLGHVAHNQLFAINSLIEKNTFLNEYKK